MEIHFSQVLGIVWISASSEIFKKPINLKCLCFSILFPYNGNPLFPCFGNCMDFYIKQKISQTLNFEIFVFSHIFSLLWEFTFPVFWELYGFLLHPKYLRNFGMFFFFPYFSHVLGIVWISASSKILKKPINLKCLCFPILFPYYGNPLLWIIRIMDFCFQQKIPYLFLTVRVHFSHILGTVCINATHEICKKPIALECLCFPILFPYYENSVISHVFGIFGIVWVSISRKIE